MLVMSSDESWRGLEQYPSSETTMRPASSPKYYDGLLRELNEAPTGSGFQSAVDRWRGFVRFW